MAGSSQSSALSGARQNAVHGRDVHVHKCVLMLKGFWVLNITSVTVRHLSGAPQAFLAWVTKSSRVIIICIHETCAYSGSIFAEVALPSMKWRQSIELPHCGGV